LPSVRRTRPLRDINDLLALGVLRKSDAGGRSTSYELNDLRQPVGVTVSGFLGGFSGKANESLSACS
jgi:hypothetical protein